MRREFDPKGWIPWPESEGLGIEFMRLLGVAQEGGSAISECFLTAGRIDPNDEESWRREWQRTADLSHERGNKALDAGYLLTAQSNWLRAIGYYQAAAMDFDPADKEQRAVLESMRKCARHYLEHLTPAGEVIEIPWLDGYALEGYFLPSPDTLNPSPTVICMGDPGQRKEGYLYKTARYARDRGMSLLAVDLLGSDSGLRFEKIVGRPDLETAIGSVMDYLTTRHDVDERRIAVLGDGAGSSFVARGVALDQRVAAAVCDGGIWDLLERDFLTNRISSRDAHSATTSGHVGIARTLKCPVLVTVGEHGWLEADRVTDLVDRLKIDRQDISLKIFLGSETASAQGHFDNPTLANEFIFDWLADRLEKLPSGASDSLRYPPQPSGRPSRDDP
jgi:dienelactone hydrolase